jgi:DNA-binding transcriptional regulator YiaG
MTERGEPEVALTPASQQTVGERIRLVRTRCKLSQSDVAHALRITKACVSSWEVGRNEISVKELTKLAEFFGVRPSTLIDGGDGAQTGALDANSLGGATLVVTVFEF